MNSPEDDLRQIRKTSQGEPLPEVTDDEVNAMAKSWGAAPQRADGVAAGGLPCIQVAGVTVWVYRVDGVMRVSLDTDDADQFTPGEWVDGVLVKMPVQVGINGTTVWEELS